MMNEQEWPTVEQVMDFERISRMEVYRRMQPGDSRALIWKNREDGEPGRLINPRSMSFDAQQRWRKEAPRQLPMRPKANPHSSACSREPL